MKYLILGLVLVLDFSFQSAFANGEGTEGGGGGFLRYHDKATEKAIITAQKELIQEIDRTSDSYFQTQFQPPLNKQDLISVISNLKLSPTVLRLRIAPDGSKDYLVMDYGIDANDRMYIEALETLYSAIEAGRFKDARDLKRQMFHESLHHFGYPNEDIAWTYSQKYFDVYCDPKKIEIYQKLGDYLSKDVTSNEVITFRLLKFGKIQYSSYGFQIDLSKLPVQVKYFDDENPSASYALTRNEKYSVGVGFFYQANLTKEQKKVWWNWRSYVSVKGFSEKTDVKDCRSGYLYHFWQTNGKVVDDGFFEMVH